MELVRVAITASWGDDVLHLFVIAGGRCRSQANPNLCRTPACGYLNDLRVRPLFRLEVLVQLVQRHAGPHERHGAVAVPGGEPACQPRLRMTKESFSEWDSRLAR